MPIYTINTVTAAELITVQKMNEEWQGNISHLLNPPSCRVTKAATQTITTATDTALLFDTERYDTDTMHSTVSNTSRITFNTAGLYIVGACIRWQASATGWRALSLRINGATNIGTNLADVDSVIQHQQSVTAVWKFSATQYVEAVVHHTNGADLNCEKAADYAPEFWATWIGIG